MKKYLNVACKLMLFALILVSCKEDPLSNLTGLTSFKFMADQKIPGLENLAFTIDQTNLLIENKDSLPYKTDVSKLTAVFEAVLNATVMVNNVPQVSGTTTNDFSSPVTYKVTAQDGITVKYYTVKVNVAKTNPETVRWNREISSITDMKYETLAAVWFNGKIRAIFGSTAGNVVATKYFTSADGKAWTEKTVSEASFPMGSMHRLVVHNNKLYVCGYLTVGSPWGFPMRAGAPEIWESADGESFTKLGTTYTFDSGKLISSLYSVNNKLWVVGGNTLGFGNPNGTKSTGSDFYGPAGLSNRIHNSSDMTTWDEPATALLPDGAPRRYSANIVHGGKMFMIGGQIAGGFLKNDVWSSSDGLTWTKVSEGGFTARMQAAAVSYDNKIWLIGGQTSLGTCSKEILVSTDGGVTWTLAANDVALPGDFAPRAGHSAFLDGANKLWIIGGYAAELKVETVDGVEQRSEIITPKGDAWSGKLNKFN